MLAAEVWVRRERAESRASERCVGAAQAGCGRISDQRRGENDGWKKGIARLAATALVHAALGCELAVAITWSRNWRTYCCVERGRREI